MRFYGTQPKDLENTLKMKEIMVEDICFECPYLMHCYTRSSINKFVNQDNSDAYCFDGTKQSKRDLIDSVIRLAI